MNDPFCQLFFSAEVLESFATHPPLILPSSGFIIDLNRTPDSDEFYKNMIILKEKFENVDDDEGGTLPNVPSKHLHIQNQQ